eukprot:scaffold1340_cov233-Amphora_coffeaeformis.AAC.13
MVSDGPVQIETRQNGPMRIFVTYLAFLAFSTGIAETGADLVRLQQVFRLVCLRPFRFKTFGVAKTAGSEHFSFLDKGKGSSSVFANDANLATLAVGFVVLR